MTAAASGDIWRLSVEGRVCAVTGAGRGLGRTVARSFVRAGGRVAYVSRTPHADVLAEVEDAGAEAIFIQADVSVPADVERAFAQIATSFGKLDVLVNNAGIAAPNALSDVSPDDWDRVMAANVRSAFLCIRQAIPLLRGSNEARIVNVSSIAGRDKSKLLGPAYSASKAALIGLTRHAAGELASLGIRVNCICPGPHHTPMLDDLLTAEVEAQIRSRIPLGYIAAPEEIAAVILFLASPASRYMTGAVVDVNGGQW